MLETPNFRHLYFYTNSRKINEKFNLNKIELENAY